MTDAPEMPSFHSTIQRLKIGPYKFNKGVYVPKDETELADFRQRLGTLERSMRNTVHEVSKEAGEKLVAELIARQGPQAANGSDSTTRNTPDPTAKPAAGSLQDLMKQQAQQQAAESTPSVPGTEVKTPPV